MRYHVTPDKKYFVVRGRLWRCTNPQLPEARRAELTRQLMHARSAVKQALKTADEEALRQARREVDAAKVALGERGPVWWSDGEPDYNRHLARNTPYAGWFQALPEEAS